MIVSFDLDCGELIPGHRFIARGIARAQPASSGELDRISLEYEIVPGVTEQEHREKGLFAFIVAIDYSPDVPFGEPVADFGAIAPFKGGPSTHGSRGNWPLPAGASRLLFRLVGRQSSGDSWDALTGTLEVNLVSGSARWVTPIP